MKAIGTIAGAAATALCALLIAPPAFAGNGNGAPTGAHYNLNIIGVPKDKKALMKDPNVTGGYGHAIFVPLEGNAKIWLTEGPDFQVLDKNGTDNDGAAFQLPAADTGVIADTPGSLDECTYDVAGDFYVCGSGETVYSVFARALGTPGGQASVMLCGSYIDETTGLPVEICSTDNVLSLHSSTRPGKFTNVTANLLYLYNVTINGEFYKRIPLFSDALYGYSWDYDNQGLKLLQLRFYWCSTLVPVDWPGEIDDSACFVK